MSKKTNSSGTIFPSLLLTAFIVLKLCKVITWSWLWVLSPVWIPIAIAVIWLFICWMFRNKNASVIILCLFLFSCTKDAAVEPTSKVQWKLIKRDTITNTCCYQANKVSATAGSVLIKPKIVCVPCDSVMNKNN
ncbi:MAG: hypothetical protein QM768_21695 [Agriterribacter sp.]